MQRVIQAAGIFQPMRCMRAKLARLQARARARRRDRRAAIKCGRDLSVPKALSRRAEAAPTFQIPHSTLSAQLCRGFYQTSRRLELRLKLVRCPHSLAPTLVALPSMSRVPRAPFPKLVGALIRVSVSL